MLQRVVALLFTLLTMVPSIADREGEELKLGDPAPEFTLKDANERGHSLAKLFEEGDTSDRIVILVMGDRKVRKEAGKWAMELDRICQKIRDVAVLMVADLRGKPFFVTKGMVKRYIKKANPPVPIVLDWDGEVNKRYRVQQGKANVFIADRDGGICYRKAGSYSEGLVREIKRNVWDRLRKPMLSIHKNGHEAGEHVATGIKP